jgi:hypothetical protein
VKLGKSARKWEGGSHEFVSCREGTEGAGSLEGAEKAGTRGLVSMRENRGRRKGWLSQQPGGNRRCHGGRRFDVEV